LIVGLLLFWADQTVEAGVHGTLSWASLIGSAPWLYVTAYVVLITVRNRLLNVALICACLGWYLWSILGRTLTQ
jgi:hypothetical protein